MINCDCSLSYEDTLGYCNMETEVWTTPCYGDSLLAELKSLREAGTFCDVKIQVEGTEFQVKLHGT